MAAAVNNQLTAKEAAATTALAIQSAQSDLWAATSAAQANVDELQAARDVLWTGWVPDEDRAIADDNLAAAKAAANAAYASGAAAVQAANNAQAAAERDAQAAAEAVARITADLEKARQAAGIKAPIDELIFLPSLPVRVEQNGAALGDPASGHVGVVTNNQLAIDSSLQLDEAPLVQPGMPVTIDEPDLGISATGVAGRVADTPGTDGVDGFHIYLEVLVDGASPSLVGTSLRLTISIESTGGKVTAVPVSALSLAADGSSRIQVDNNGTLTYVTVKSGLSAGGYVEVAPVNDTLQPGQLVVIGFDGNGS